MSKKRRRLPVHTKIPLIQEALQTRDTLLRIARRPVVHLADGALHRDRIILRNLQNEKDYRETEDFRRYHPSVHSRRYLRVDGKVAGWRRVPVQSRVPWVREQLRLSFSSPKKTFVCIRRKVRRAVLHALQKTGRGGGPQKRPRWSDASRIRCK